MKKLSYLFVLTLMAGLIAGLFNARPAAAEGEIFVTIASDVVADDGFCSLREAIIAANSNAPSGAQPGECPAGSAAATDVIVLNASGTYDLTIDGLGENAALTGDLDVVDNAGVDVDVALVTLGVGTAVIRSVGLDDRIWHVQPGAGLELTGVEMRGATSTQGAGLYNENGRVRLTDTLFTLNTASSGGAIMNRGANAFLTATNAQISRNNALNFGTGGGVTNKDGAILILIDSNISGNGAMGDGGGLSNESNASATLTRVRLSGNSAGECGGAVANFGGVMTLIASELTGVNTSGQYGGGLCNVLGTVGVIQGTVIELNESGYDGGGIANGGVMAIRQSIVRGNQASDGAEGIGGGLYATTNSETTITQSAFLDNTAAIYGGGIATQGLLNIYNSTIAGNTAFSGGGLLLWPGANVTAINVTIAGNSASLPSGIGILQTGGAMVMGNSLLDNHGTDCHQTGGDFDSIGHNLTSDASCFPIGSDLPSTDPMLGMLTDGAIMLQPGSPAIDAADTFLCAETPVAYVDQLGQERPLFGGCDIGAVEWQGFGLYMPTIMR